MKFRMENTRIFLTLAKGDFINQTFEVFAEKKGVGCAWLNGIGALENPEIGYYSIKDKKYHRKQFKGEFELTSLIGDITMKDGKPFAHTHITFSDTDYQVYGGHLFDAKITATGEIVLSLTDSKIDREYNKNIGIHTWCLHENH